MENPGDGVGFGEDEVRSEGKEGGPRPRQLPIGPHGLPELAAESEDERARGEEKKYRPEYVSRLPIVPCANIHVTL